jgi:hypothetical protein
MNMILAKMHGLLHGYFAKAVVHSVTLKVV